MPKLYSSAQIIKVLKNKGFIYISQKGSHIKFRIIPANKKEGPYGTFKSILRQSELTEKDFKII